MLKETLKYTSAPEGKRFLFVLAVVLAFVVVFRFRFLSGSRSIIIILHFEELVATHDAVRLLNGDDALEHFSAPRFFGEKGAR